MTRTGWYDRAATAAEVASEELLALIAEGHALLARERAAYLAGELDKVGGLNGEKEAYLAALERSVGRARGTAEIRAALAALIEDGRRSERVIDAARQGFRAARRRVQQILETARGRVAYDRDGAPIASTADALGPTRQA